MKRILLVMLLLAGCATTPNEVRETGPRSTHNLVNPPAIAAGCMARNIENHQAGFNANVRQVDAVRMEVIVRVGAEHVALVAHVQAQGKGSMAVVSQRQEWLYRSDDFAAALVKGC